MDTERRLCLGCLSVRIIIDPINVFCANCHLHAHLNKRFPVPTRSEIIAGFDHDEYVPEDEEWVSA